MATADALKKLDEALLAVESAILYAVLEKQPPKVVEGLRRTHKRAQDTYNLIEERQIRG